jgi:hypothetical protein
VPLPLPDSDVEGVVLDVSFPEPVPGSFEDPSFEDGLAAGLFEESEVDELRESVL